MRNMMKYSLTAFSIFFALSSLKAQVKDASFQLSEIVKLSENYRNNPNLNFSLAYTYADSTNPTAYLEQMSGQCKISNGKSWTMLDNVEMIQGSQYTLSLYHDDSIMIINDKKDYENVMKLPFLDSVFRSSNVDTIYSGYVDDSLRTMTILFKVSSAYSKYQLLYNIKKARAQKVEYYLRNVPYDAAGVTSGTAVITLTISNYDSVTQIDQSIFNEWKYMYKANGNFNTNPAYAHFSLVNYSLN